MKKQKACMRKHAGFFAAPMVAGLALPAAVVEPPTARTLLPARWRIVVIATAHAFPVTADPDVTMTIPGPIARCPDIATAWRWCCFVARWRRCLADTDIDRIAHLRLGHWRGQQRCGTAGRKQNG